MAKRRESAAKQARSVLARTLTNERGKMSPTVARWFLTWGFSRADQDRMSDLAERNQDGALSPAERTELTEYVAVGHLLAQLHAIAHMSLKPPRKRKV
jgi:hypothetical protein